MVATPCCAKDVEVLGDFPLVNISMTLAFNYWPSLSTLDLLHRHWQLLSAYDPYILSTLPMIPAFC